MDCSTITAGSTVPNFKKIKTENKNNDNFKIKALSQEKRENIFRNIESPCNGIRKRRFKFSKNLTVNKDNDNFGINPLLPPTPLLPQIKN